MLGLGFFCGLLAAHAQAYSYLLSRAFVLHHGSAWRLLALAHLWMGLVCALLLPFFFFTPQAGWLPALPPLALGLGSYLAAQFCFFWTVSKAPASRVGPLMGTKVVILALLVSLVGLEELNALHWTAVALTGLATWLVGISGVSIGGRAWLGLLATISCFAASDIGISMLIGVLDVRRSLPAALLALLLHYSLATLPALLLLCRQGKPQGTEIPASRAYAATWLLGMCGLYGAIALLGVVLAILLQALRGPLAVLFGALASRRPEHRSREQHFDRASLIRQVLAALVMAMAGGLYAAAGGLD